MDAIESAGALKHLTNDCIEINCGKNQSIHSMKTLAEAICKKMYALDINYYCRYRDFFLIK